MLLNKSNISVTNGEVEGVFDKDAAVTLKSAMQKLRNTRKDCDELEEEDEEDLVSNESDTENVNV